MSLYEAEPGCWAIFLCLQGIQGERPLTRLCIQAIGRATGKMATSSFDGRGRGSVGSTGWGDTKSTVSGLAAFSFLENAALCDLTCEACKILVGDDSRLEAMVTQQQRLALWMGFVFLFRWRLWFFFFSRCC